MGHPQGKKEQSRTKILAGAGRAFRSQGYGGSGVDSLAKASGVTSGAFYAHFPSKADAFRETVVAGMRELEAAIRQQQADDREHWVERFVDFYLGEKRTCELSESCALQSLTGEVARANDETREAYEAELRAVIDAAASASGPAAQRARRQETIALLALLAGGVSVARAVKDPALADEIAKAVRAAAVNLRASAAPAEPASARPRPRRRARGGTT